jgi:hypothetical protein
MPEETFKDEASYRRWNAYRHIHGIEAPNLKYVTVGGKRHKVKHSKRSGKSEARRKSGRGSRRAR